MEQTNLFDSEWSLNIPLASRVRPRTLEDFVGQGHLVGEGKFLRGMLDKDQISSMIFWGPPGVGKTTLAEIIAKTTQSRFVTFSAVMNGIKEIRSILLPTDRRRQRSSYQTTS
ncbi:AAA family ATPase [Streptococcus cuniculi]|uniref:AAA family ATPase n=1 Tax=Streptococcus cuniculi TaxID=1432788 RepID=A0A4Y9JAS9_9STRE|nr:AAA family ATPase [Streptococcus cuniculi]TFU98113.1 AAA family ATPase [Streptococcus cuniculi]